LTGPAQINRLSILPVPERLFDVLAAGRTKPALTGNGMGEMQIWIPLDA
jgi:hypothetical protein